MADCFCDINEAWRRVREARTYDSLVDRAQEWLDLFWPKARSMHLNSRSVASYPPPPIRIDYRMEAAGAWNGKSIALMDQERWKKSLTQIAHVYKMDGVTPVLRSFRDEVRAVLLHEVQHALDEPEKDDLLRFVALTKKERDEQELFEHTPAFNRRLRRLERAFPYNGG